MKPQKPISPNAQDRDNRARLGHGRMKPWKRDELPDFNPHRQIKKTSRCAVCGYPARAGQPIYVCTNCGNCQACGGLNTLGQLSAGCVLCGNGLAAVQNTANLESVSTIVSNQPTADHRPDKRQSREAPAFDHPPQDGIHLINQNE